MLVFFFFSQTNGLFNYTNWEFPEHRKDVGETNRNLETGMINLEICHIEGLTNIICY